MQTKEIPTAQFPADLRTLLQEAPSVQYPQDRDDLIALSFGGSDADYFEVNYEVPGRGQITEATVARCTNGAVVNYTDPYMRRRDPDCMLIADDLPTDKEHFRDRYGTPFEGLRQETFAWLKQQDLLVTFFKAGGEKFGYPSVLVAPANAAFFALALADLQGFIPPDEIDESFVPVSAIYLAPPFRHTQFEGEQAVVHNRTPEIHEIFSYNLYPGPSAKKGVYGLLLSVGEREGWTTAHGATVRLTTPYDNVFTLMHEGASGAGKSEILEEIHRQPDGRILIGENLVSKERLVFSLGDTCKLERVTDDMALCHPSLQKDPRKLTVVDAEHGWFIRIDHITKYGTDPHYEKLTIHPKEPLIFMNLKGVPQSTCLIWEHTEDEPGKRCPNPRVILPRDMVPGVRSEATTIDLRSFGVRTPPCTAAQPTYGIVGMLHILPPSLGWLWRLVAPRGHANPSITESSGLSSEGVGSYWPFATGRFVEHANLLLRQILAAPATRFTLTPNQYIGAWRVGFMPEWLAREYLARRGSAKLRPEQTRPSRCALLGYALTSMRVDGNPIPHGFLEVENQPEVGEEAYDAGAKILQDFFKRELRKFLTPELDSLGKDIIHCCLDDGNVSDYRALIPMD